MRAVTVAREATARRQLALHVAAALFEAANGPDVYAPGVPCVVPAGLGSSTPLRSAKPGEAELAHLKRRGELGRASERVFTRAREDLAARQPRGGRTIRRGVFVLRLEALSVRSASSLTVLSRYRGELQFRPDDLRLIWSLSSSPVEWRADEGVYKLLRSGPAVAALEALAAELIDSGLFSISSEAC